MQSNQPSRTAVRVARYRADHQILKAGVIFRDPFAEKILGNARLAPKALAMALTAISRDLPSVHQARIS
ncbi:hypothetical protein LQ948_12190 [Jiella sp. MQZ9-1]|uniref:Uncharacterized protein n=1 Tax=Jiella flava TaxID=2816857 RepID=A0A939JXI3_9HYPH|nr:hypothetical protein [Jiella flava]MBO0663396.1 hypothetical protein [Jiella flava]MCD2471972.1 hypothetical protein [Jiella flava]